MNTPFNLVATPASSRRQGTVGGRRREPAAQPSPPRRRPSTHPGGRTTRLAAPRRPPHPHPAALPQRASLARTRGTWERCCCPTRRGSGADLFSGWGGVCVGGVGGWVGGSNNGRGGMLRSSGSSDDACCCFASGARLQPARLSCSAPARLPCPRDPQAGLTRVADAAVGHLQANVVGPDCGKGGGGGGGSGSRVSQGVL